MFGALARAVGRLPSGNNIKTLPTRRSSRPFSATAAAAATAAAMEKEKFKLIWTVPDSHLAPTKEAVFDAGAGVYEDGKYVQVAFQTMGQGQFVPVAEAGAAPRTGTVGQLEHVLEYKVEVLCEGREVVENAVAALKKHVGAHPYEVPAYEVYKMEDL